MKKESYIKLLQEVKETERGEEVTVTVDINEVSGLDLFFFFLRLFKSNHDLLKTCEAAVDAVRGERVRKTLGVVEDEDEEGGDYDG